MTEFGGLWKHQKSLPTLCNYLGLVSATPLQLAFLGENDSNFPWDQFPLGQLSVQNKQTNIQYNKHTGKNVLYITIRWDISHAMSLLKVITFRCRSSV